MDLLAIAELNTNSTNFVCVVVVIASEKPRVAPVKFTTINKRYVFNFTVKDQLNDSINVTCWGGAEFLLPIADICQIGSLVEIHNPRVRMTDIGYLDRNYFPPVSSQFKFDLVENFSTVVPYNCPPNDPTVSMLITALRTPNLSEYDKVTVEDILNKTTYSEGDLVTVLVVVAAKGRVLDFTTKDGRSCRRLEIKVTDKTTRTISLILWDPTAQTFSEQWIPFHTMLYLTEVRVSRDKYFNKKTLVMTSRSVCTADPNTSDAKDLLSFATNYLANSEMFARTIQQDVPKFNKNEARVAPSISALQKMISRENEVGCSEQVLVQCFVTDFNLTSNRILFWKCGSCGRFLGPYEGDLELPPCINADCNVDESVDEVYIDFSVSLTDETGTVKRCRVSSDHAESILNVKVDEFLAMSDSEKIALETPFYMEYCEVGLQIEHLQENKKIVNVIHLRSNLKGAF